MIEIVSLIKIYSQKENNILALNNISFKANDGEFISFIGESGSGKSTLLKILSGNLKPSAGTIFINEEEIFTKTEREVVEFQRIKLGFVDGDRKSNLELNLSCYENIKLNLIFRNKELNNIDTYIDKLFDDFNLTYLKHRKVKYLSGGEVQMIAFMKAISHKPDLLLLDEPTSSIDPIRTVEVMDFFQTYLKENKITCILVTHDLAVASRSDKIYTLSKGKNVNVESTETIDTSKNTLLQGIDKVYSIPISNDGILVIPQEIQDKMDLNDHIILVQSNGILMIANSIEKFQNIATKLKEDN